MRYIFNLGKDEHCRKSSIPRIVINSLAIGSLSVICPMSLVKDSIYCPCLVSYTTFTCGEPHDQRNPNWKPFRLLWDYCERARYDFFEVRDLIEKRIGYKLTCECQLVDGGKEKRRLELERTFGVYFGEPGNRCVDVV